MVLLTRGVVTSATERRGPTLGDVAGRLGPQSRALGQ